MSRKTVLIFLICILVALTGGAYLYGVKYFSEHYFPGSQVNGYNCSYMTVAQAEALMNREAEAFVLAVETQGNGREAITAKDVGLSYHSDGTIASQIASQEVYRWFLAFNDTHSYDLSRSLSYDPEMLTEAVSALKCISDPGIQPPQNAYIYVLDDGSYAIHNESAGNTVDFRKAQDLIAQAMLSGKVTVNLVDEGCYIRPTITSRDPLLNTNVDIMNRLIQVIITYDFGNSTQRVDRAAISSWFTEDASGLVVLDYAKVRDYVQALADVYDTVGGLRSFVTYLGTNIQITGGDYGWIIDVEAETQALYEAINNGQTQVREPIYTIRGVTRAGTNDIGYTYVEVCKANQKIVYYNNGVPLLEAFCVTGAETPIGVFRAGVKQSPYHLTRGFKYSVPIVEEFSDGQSLADTSNVTIQGGILTGADVNVWLPFGDFGISEGVARTNVYGIEAYNASPTTGNVEVPLDIAVSLYSIFEEGMPVVVY